MEDISSFITDSSSIYDPPPAGPRARGPPPLRPGRIQVSIIMSQTVVFNTQGRETQLHNATHKYSILHDTQRTIAHGSEKCVSVYKCDLVHFLCSAESVCSSILGLIFIIYSPGPTAGRRTPGRSDGTFGYHHAASRAAAAKASAACPRSGQKVLR